MKHKGFTLIELMLVIALIAILYSVLVPNYKYYNNKVKDRSAVIYGQQINSAVMYSYGKNNGVYDMKKVREAINNYTSVNVLDVSEENNKIDVSVSFEFNGEEYKFIKKFIKKSINSFELINNKGKAIYEE